jgi:hypothetical protein
VEGEGFFEIGMHWGNLTWTLATCVRNYVIDRRRA